MENKSRVILFDELRGVSILSMLLYHLCYDLAVLFGVGGMQWFFSPAASLWQLCICGVFIFVAGACCSYSKNNLRRGLRLFLLGMLFTVVTAVVMPDQLIVFGLLHFLGVAVLVSIPCRRAFAHIKPSLPHQLAVLPRLLQSGLCLGGLFPAAALSVFVLGRVIFLASETAVVLLPQPLPSACLFGQEQPVDLSVPSAGAVSCAVADLCIERRTGLKQQFTISQVAQMLGLGIDAVRFYEKKGLVHPQINPDNRYRLYTLHQVMELLDVSYYRSLGMSISQISSIYQDSDENQLLGLLEQKRLETQRRIRYEQQMLGRIEHVEAIARRICEQGQEMDVADFPACDILFEQRQDSLEGYLRQVSDMDHDHFIFCQLAREFLLGSDKDSVQLIQQRTMLLMDCRITAELGTQQRQKQLDGVRALHSVVRLPKAELQEQDVLAMLNCARRRGLSLSDRLLMIEIPMISYTNLDHYYAELFIPLK